MNHTSLTHSTSIGSKSLENDHATALRSAGREKAPENKLNQSLLK